MTRPFSSAVTSLPEYHELLRRRRLITIPLIIAMLGAYFSFILLVAYKPVFLAQTVGAGVLTYGIIFGLGIILLTLAITVVYVWYSNSRIENLVIDIKQKAVAHE